MANVCEICGKAPRFEKNVSHSHRRSPRRVEPNIQKVRANRNGKIATLRVCTSCLKAGKVVKA